MNIELYLEYILGISGIFIIFVLFVSAVSLLGLDEEPLPGWMDFVMKPVLLIVFPVFVICLFFYISIILS